MNQHRRNIASLTEPMRETSDRLLFLHGLMIGAHPDVCIPLPGVTGKRSRVILLEHPGYAQRAVLAMWTNTEPKNKKLPDGSHEKLHAAHDPWKCYVGETCLNGHHLRWATPTENGEDRAIRAANEEELRRRKEWAERNFGPAEQMLTKESFIKFIELWQVHELGDNRYLSYPNDP